MEDNYGYSGDFNFGMGSALGADASITAAADAAGTATTGIPLGTVANSLSKAVNTVKKLFGGKKKPSAQTLDEKRDWGYGTFIGGGSFSVGKSAGKKGRQEAWEQGWFMAKSDVEAAINSARNKYNAGGDIEEITKAIADAIPVRGYASQSGALSGMVERALQPYIAPLLQKSAGEAKKSADIKAAAEAKAAAAGVKAEAEASVPLPRKKAGTKTEEQAPLKLGGKRRTPAVATASFLPEGMTKYLPIVAGLVMFGLIFSSLGRRGGTYIIPAPKQ